ncbi:DUF5994 family protein [Streptomyces pseudovenezuelae]|uniref:Uncharacterized protein n=1 Tax=Streptomyces pseudovenezuelae TaxID=67350 RepID=A0ABT6LHE5_9ACTN|nr:DUF5994 family protein [Streptomyces pseudovenezuelae]MDH6215209.1 hypothetical protein [Streptomyces pseudovenezuelae]
MTATISSSPKHEAADRLSEPPSSPSSPLRLALAPTGSTPPLLDGAWWPRSRDLAAELPLLTAVLDPLWGRITRITVNPTHWPTVPRKVSVAGHVVKVGWFLHEQDEHELLLLSYHVGRWNLLVIPPSTPPDTAAWLMTAATDPLGTSPGSRLMEEAARLGTTSEADANGDGDGAAVWDSEGGHEARAGSPGAREGDSEAREGDRAARTRIPAQPRT